MFSFNPTKSQEENIKEFISHLKNADPELGLYIELNINKIIKLPEIESQNAKSTARKNICNDILRIIESSQDKEVI